jgi:hypothetical protein
MRRIMMLRAGEMGENGYLEGEITPKGGIFVRKRGYLR